VPGTGMAAQLPMVATVMSCSSRGGSSTGE
jgi:hypothetical protein